jgi:hypothetical protein
VYVGISNVNVSRFDTVVFQIVGTVKYYRILSFPSIGSEEKVTKGSKQLEEKLVILM